MSRTHALKAHPAPFLDVWTGRKTFEVRRDDRGYQVGDILRLQEWTPTEAHDEAVLGAGGYTGRVAIVLVTYILPGGQWGLPDDLCVMAIDVIGREFPR
jgi:hypothetical protein